MAYSVTSDTLYCAKVLDVDSSKMLIQKRSREELSGHYNPRNDVIYCFVVLTTSDFEGRAAHFGVTANNEVRISTIYDVLNESDKANLKKGILNSSVAPELKELLKTTT